MGASYAAASGPISTPTPLMSSCPAAVLGSSARRESSRRSVSSCLTACRQIRTPGSTWVASACVGSSRTWSSVGPGRGPRPGRRKTSRWSCTYGVGKALRWCLTIFVKCTIILTIHLTTLVQLAYLAVVRTHDSSLQSTHKSKRGPYGRYYDEGPDAGSAASAGTPHGPDFQRRAVTRVRVVCTRGRDDRLAAAGGHLRGARCHPLGRGGTRSEARGREDLGRGQPADDHGHEGAGGRGEGREGPSL